MGDRAAARQAAIALRSLEVATALGERSFLVVTMTRVPGTSTEQKRPKGELVVGVPLAGVLETWHDDRNPDRSWGFIRPSVGGLEIFVQKACFIGKVPPSPGMEVTFAVGQPA